MKVLMPRGLYGVKGNPAESRFKIFRVDLFKAGCQVAIDINGALTTALTVSGATTTAFLISGASTTAVSITGSATDAFKCAIGTFTRGLNIGGTVTTGIQVAACSTTAISITGAQTAGIIVSGTHDVGIRIGTSGTPIAYTTVTDKMLSFYGTCNTTNGATNYEPAIFNTVMTGAGQVGGRVRVHMETNVVLGGWANAFKASVDLKSAGGCTGLLSAICGELVAAGKANAATLAVLELELVTVASATFDHRHSLIYSNISGNSTANTSFQENGVIWYFDGLGAATAGEIFDECVAPAASHSLRINIGGTFYYILLQSNVDAS